MKRCKGCGRPFQPRRSSRVYCFGCPDGDSRRVTLRTAAERLLELDDDALAAQMTRLRIAMALKHPDLYRLNADGTVDYIGPTREG
jgi:hypothetical protein